MDNITFEKLQKTHGDRAEEIFNKIARIGGWGEGREYKNSDGFDLIGLSDAKRAQVEKLLALPETDESADDEETVESLLKLSRGDLEALAKEKGLDGNSYTNKTELAQAILNKKE